MSIQKKFLVLAGLSGVISVSLGALGAHTLRERLDEKMMDAFNKGVLYEFIHTLALLALVPLYDHYKQKTFVIAGWCWVIGMVLFSGSLYLLSVRELLGWEGLSVIGIVTPFGGVAFIAGWLCLAIGGTRIKAT